MNGPRTKSRKDYLSTSPACEDAWNPADMNKSDPPVSLPNTACIRRSSRRYRLIYAGNPVDILDYTRLNIGGNPAGID